MARLLLSLGEMKSKQPKRKQPKQDDDNDAVTNDQYNDARKITTNEWRQQLLFFKQFSTGSKSIYFVISKNGFETYGNTMILKNKKRTTSRQRDCIKNVKNFFKLAISKFVNSI